VLEAARIGRLEDGRQFAAVV